MSSKCYLVPVKIACNAACFFCSTKTYNPKTNTNVMQVDDLFLQNISTLKFNNIQRVEITGGGEPFLNPMLSEIITVLRSEYPEVYIKTYTNGSILKPIPMIDEINISRTHWDATINNQFMRFRNNNIDLESSILFFREIGVPRIRISIPLIKGAIDHGDKLNEFISRVGHLVDGYVVRPLYPNTPSREEYFSDFDFMHPKAQVDRDACCYSQCRPLIIWASDNHFYNSWSMDGTYIFNVESMEN